MSPSDRALVRKLEIAVILKLLVLLALWWAFIREQRVEVDGRAAAAHVLGTPHNDDKE
ncbi:MAG: cytochrome oxidase putative small subunit CydP [Hylemonella sp.]